MRDPAAATHLDEATRDLLNLSDEQRIACIDRDLWIGYGRAKEAHSRLDRVLSSQRRMRPDNLLIVGASNNGEDGDRPPCRRRGAATVHARCSGKAGRPCSRVGITAGRFLTYNIALAVCGRMAGRISGASGVLSTSRPAGITTVACMTNAGNVIPPFRLSIREPSIDSPAVQPVTQP